jgi:hypothetical protein
MQCLRLRENPKKRKERTMTVRTIEIKMNLFP